MKKQRGEIDVLAVLAVCGVTFIFSLLWGGVAWGEYLKAECVKFNQFRTASDVIAICKK